MQHFCSEMVVSAKSVVNPTASDVGWRIQTCCETERDVGHQRVDLSLKHLPNMLLCGHLPNMLLCGQILAKKGPFLIFEW